MLVVRWLSGAAKGGIDYIPRDWFLAEGKTLGVRHAFRGIDGLMYEASCDVEVAGSLAIIDYGKLNEDHNRSVFADLGRFQIEFADAARETVKEILWEEEDEEGFAEGPFSYDFQDDLVSALEGTKYFKSHVSYERDPALVRLKKEEVLKSGRLICEACDFDFEERYGKYGFNFCEVHHREPLHGGPPRNTTLAGLAILCANCHRIIHRTVPIMDVEVFRSTVVRPRAEP